MLTGLYLSQEQHEDQNGADKRRAHNQLPYFLSREAQDQSIIKAGYCVKQGAVVRTNNRRKPVFRDRLTQFWTKTYILGHPASGSTGS